MKRKGEPLNQLLARFALKPKSSKPKPRLALPYTEAREAARGKP